MNEFVTEDEGVIMQAATDETGSIVYMSYDPRQKFSNGQLVVLYNTTEPKDVTELQVVSQWELDTMKLVTLYNRMEQV